MYIIYCFDISRIFALLIASLIFLLLAEDTLAEKEKRTNYWLSACLDVSIHPE